jgi:hypothetical protein
MQTSSRLVTPTADPADVAVEIDVIRTWTVLERARTAASPAESPVALIVQRESACAERLLHRLGDVELAPAETAPLSCAWVPRARLVRALRPLDAVEALRLERLPGTDVRRWAVLHVGAAFRTAVHGGERGPVARAAEAEILSFVQWRGCGDARCVGDAEHDWDEREVRGEDGAARDDATCVRCGMPYELFVSWSAWGE